MSSLCVFSEASASVLVPADLTPTVYEVKQVNADDYARRAAPKEVPPVEHGEVVYVVLHFAFQNGTNQHGGYIEARNKATGKKLWGVQVYTTSYDKDLEQDVQDVFITEMKLDPNRALLNVKDEDGREYTVDLQTQKVTRLEKQ